MRRNIYRGTKKPVADVTGNQIQGPWLELPVLQSLRYDHQASTSLHNPHAAQEVLNCLICNSALLYRYFDFLAPDNYGIGDLNFNTLLHLGEVSDPPLLAGDEKGKS